MRLRTFLLLLLVLAVAAIGVVIVVLGLNGTGPLASLLSSATPAPIVADDGVAAEGTPGAGVVAEPSPTPTPEMRFVPIVVARVDIQAGTIIRSDILETELRPETNIAVVQQYAFTDMMQVVGRIATVEISAGQEVLGDMLTDNPANIRSFGSDLALFIPQGNVAVPLPIDSYSGLAYSMRPGDRVDVMMSMDYAQVDPEFQSALPNGIAEVDPLALQDGVDFLFPENAFVGRLELIPLINQVAALGPPLPYQIARPVTQLMIQQAEVLWVGTWVNNQNSPVLLTIDQPRLEDDPDVIILSMPLQDALSLKWALESGLDLDLALRAQGDTSLFVTTSVSLPQMVEQSGITIPSLDDVEFRLEPNIIDVPAPALPERAVPDRPEAPENPTPTPAPTEEPTPEPTATGAADGG